MVTQMSTYVKTVFAKAHPVGLLQPWMFAGSTPVWHSVLTKLKADRYSSVGKKKIPEKYQRWIGARKRYHLSHAHIQMARELGLNPKKFGSLDSTKRQPRKLPLPEFIEELYTKHFKKNRPENVRFIEQMVRDYRKQKHERKIRRIEKKNIDPSGEGEEWQQ